MSKPSEKEAGLHPNVEMPTPRHDLMIVHHLRSFQECLGISDHPGTVSWDDMHIGQEVSRLQYLFLLFLIPDVQSDLTSYPMLQGNVPLLKEIISKGDDHDKVKVAQRNLPIITSRLEIVSAAITHHLAVLTRLEDEFRTQRIVERIQQGDVGWRSKAEYLPELQAELSRLSIALESTRGIQPLVWAVKDLEQRYSDPVHTEVYVLTLEAQGLLKVCTDMIPQLIQLLHAASNKSVSDAQNFSS